MRHQLRALSLPLLPLYGTTMAPKDVEQQTEEIIRFLFEDLHTSCRQLDAAGQLETDSSDSYDPVLIADKLRRVADRLDDDARFRDALTEMRKTASQEVVDAAFSQGVEALCKNPVSQRAEVAPEVQLIRASVSFGLYLKKSFPELKAHVQHAMVGFLNSRVGPWVAKQGGWDKIPEISN